MIFGTQYPNFNPSTSTYEDLSCTGNLSVIKDIKLRDQFVEWNFKTNSDWATPIDAPLLPKQMP